MRIFINVKNSIRKILREEHIDFVNPLLGKMVIFNSSAKKEDIQVVLDFFKENGIPLPLEDRSWTDEDVDIVVEDYLMKGRDLGIGADYYSTDITEGINIKWGNPNHFKNSSYTFIPYRDFICKFVNGFSTDDAFNKLYESKDELDWVNDLKGEKFGEGVEDDFDWAKQSIQSEITLKSIWKYLEIGDQITLSGDISNDEDEILLILNNEPFEVEKRYDDGFHFSWLKNPEERPGGWQAINTHTKSKDVIELNLYKFPTDGDLIVNSFNKTDYPF